MEQAQASQGFQPQLQQIAQMVLDARNQAQLRELQGAENAYERALQYGGSGGGGGGGGSAGGVDINDFLQHGNQTGLSGESLVNIAAQQAPNYNGVTFAPHAVMNEGQVFTDQNGKPYVNVKFSAPGQGSSTEKVYLP